MLNWIFTNFLISTEFWSGQMEKVILEVPLLKSVYVNRHLLGIDPSESWCWTQNFALFCRLNSIWSNKELWLLTESRTLLPRQFRSVGVVTLSARHFKTRKICFWDTSSWKGRNEQVLQGLGTYLETSLLTAYPPVVHLQGILNVDGRGLSKQTKEAEWCYQRNDNLKLFMCRPLKWRGLSE